MEIIYRPHRGGFAEAMSEAKVFESVDEMKRSIHRSWTKMFEVAPFDIEDIVVRFDKPGVIDDRNGWEDTRYVCVKRMFNEVYSVPQCIGMCATIFPEG